MAPVAKAMPAVRTLSDRVAEEIARRFRAGDTIGLLAWDYNRTHLEIEAAIRAWMLAVGKRGGRC